MKNNFFKITSIILSSLIAILLFESIFGYWFKKNNFGYLMRSERQKKIYIETKHDKIKYKFYYKRNFYGFRGNEVDPKDIKIVFLGGSTGNQKFTPEDLTIVGLLNSKFEKDQFDFKIYNGSTDGKTTRGYINDFKFWFPKIPDFNPKVIIFYIGINDASLNQPDKYDTPWRETNIEKFRDYMKSNSKIYELLKKIKFKYFLKLRKEYEMTRISETLYKNYDYINYIQATKLHVNKKKNIELVNRFIERLNALKFYIDKFNIVPIFITQIEYNGIKNYNLYLINDELKKFCEENKFNIIKIDEKIIYLDKYSFYDGSHTLVKGSKKLAEYIYPDLLSILNKVNNKF